MSTWIEIETDDLYTYLASQQVDALRKTAIADQQNDPVGDIISDISLKIRSQIVSNKKNALSSRKYAIPPELKSVACSLIVETAQTRIPGLKLTADQVRLADQSREYLQKIVKGDLLVSEPDDMDAGFKKTVEVIHSRPHFVSEKTMKGF